MNAVMPSRVEGLRTQETNLGDLCADAFLWAAGVSTGTKPDAAVLNGGVIRSSLEEGDITLRDIRSVFPFSNQVVVLNVTGAQLLEALEAGYQEVGVGASAAFPQVAGIEVAVDSTVPYEPGDLYPNSTFHGPANPGSRVTIHSVGGKPWEADARYLLATSDFLCQGGNTYYAFKRAADTEIPAVCDFDYEALSGFLTVACDHEVPNVYSEPQGRIRIVS